MSPGPCERFVTRLTDVEAAIYDLRTELDARSAKRDNAVAQLVTALREQTEAIRAFNEFVAGDERVSYSMIPVGDGLSFCRKR